VEQVHSLYSPLMRFPSQVYHIKVKIWDLEADKCREEFIPAIDIPVKSLSIVSRVPFAVSTIHIQFKEQ